MTLPLDMDNLHLYRDLLVTVVKARMTMDTASARADILLNIFLINLEHPGKVEQFIERTLNNVEQDLLADRDAPAPLREATEEVARAIWSYRMRATNDEDQNVRVAFERWEAMYLQSIGESPTDTYMDIENARCLSEPDYYSEPPLPFVTRARSMRGNRN